jgi:capsular polysaccharide biosynthesis protein
LQPSLENETPASAYASRKARFLLRRWPWVLLAAVVGAAVGVALSAMAPTTYVAQSVVVATDVAVAPEDFGTVAQATFATDTVLQPVVDRLGLHQTPHSLLSTGALQAESVSGGPALQITGRASDARLAASLANAAADSFVAVAREKGLGTVAAFTTQGLGVRQTSPLVANGVLGALAGAALAGLALLALVFFRDPIITREDAAEDFAADAAFQVTVDATRAARRRSEKAGPATATTIRPSGSIQRLWTAICEGVDGRADGACAVVVRGGRSDWPARAIARQLQIRAESDRMWRERSIPFSRLEASDARLRSVLADQRAVIAIVTSGTPRRALRRFDEDFQASSAAFRMLVLVHPRRPS